MISLEYVWIRNYETSRTIAVHQHSCFEFIYYLKGSGKGFYADTDYSYEAGTFVLLRPNTQHGETHETLTSMISIGFQVQNFFEEPQNCVLKSENSVFFDTVQNIRHELKNKLPFYKQKIEILLELLLTEILRATSGSEPEKKNSLDYTISYIKEYFMANLDLHQLAKSAGYCDDQFRVLFRKKTGSSPKNFILDLRLNAAKKMLADTENELSDIAVKCGYEYYSQFSLFFKKKTGQTPSEYREKILAQTKTEN